MVHGLCGVHDAAIIIFVAILRGAAMGKLIAGIAPCNLSLGLLLALIRTEKLANVRGAAAQQQEEANEDDGADTATGSDGAATPPTATGSRTGVVELCA
ncbi:hypothetical protein CFL01nite_02570 [Corynebacterium flavescens]|uniref:Uncharacterized protein n=1 Tax=Corynebacterium flavescens TaxID=28028 RepID=A0AB73B543_CORFL|nr:hypothetical protein CFL01nite_02570 [Corynebacterium flavescens]